MHAWESIQNVLEHIENNISLEHSPKELAKIASLSPFYFQRLFTRLVKRPVNEYVKMRRLARACEVLENKSKRILDIALDYGFSSHEVFTKTFKNAFGITPEEYRNNPVRLNQITKPNLLLGYTVIDENVPLITDGIIVEIARKTLNSSELYIGLTAQVSIVEQTPLGEVTGIDVPGMLWEKFHSQKSSVHGFAPKGIEIGASTMGQGDECSFSYFVGATAASDTDITGEFVKWELPASEYIVCSVEGENFEELVTSALNKSMNYLFSTWLPKHNLTAQPFSAEKYYKNSHDISKMEIWVIPVPMTNSEIR